MALLRALPLVLLAACAPRLEDDPALVAASRVIAWRATPAEAAPGEAVRLQALLVGPAGTLAGDALGWSLCSTPRPPGENGAVAQACALATPPALAAGDLVVLTIPPEACTIFGPEPAPATPGQPARRPADPDATGGYYQPIRISGAGEAVFGLQRLSCAPAGVSLETARAFRARYTANRNPTLLPPASRGAVPLGAAVTLVAAWPADAVETYPIVDPARDLLVDRRETLRVSWFATAGRFDRESTVAADGASSVTNVWRAPATPGIVHLWLVLRDSRGGSDFAALDLSIVP
jgi:hypothetical protein